MWLGFARVGSSLLKTIHRGWYKVMISERPIYWFNRYIGPFSVLLIEQRSQELLIHTWLFLHPPRRKWTSSWCTISFLDPLICFCLMLIDISCLQNHSPLRKAFRSSSLQCTIAFSLQHRENQKLPITTVILVFSSRLKRKQPNYVDWVVALWLIALYWW